MRANVQQEGAVADYFIDIRQLYKTFRSRGKSFPVLKGITLGVPKGGVYGVVGFSGAGKSTLLRCINRLETPDSGTVSVGGREITALSRRELAGCRRKIGVIFQQFNLLDSRTVAGNVAFPLEVAGTDRAAVSARVAEMLELVGLSDKRGFYPGQLSGGQKQRVGIARALANRPDVLLSDEATSALDPLSSLSILDLLRDINEKLGLTVVLVTHELDVVRYACSQVAVLEDGRIAETGSADSVFQNPSSETARAFAKITRTFASHKWQHGEGI
jgi:D-methionine transport system ATP-binding protein